MTFLGFVAFVGIMVVLAALPSASVALVVARSSSGGLLNGLATTMGIVVADLLFIAVAMMGMTALAVSLGSVFSVVRWIGGAYLIWLGVKLVMSKETTPWALGKERGSALVSSFAAGFLLTLGDLKAILFYASLFPALLDLPSLRAWDLVLIGMATIVTVGGVKMVYAIAARAVTDRLGWARGHRLGKSLAGGLMIGTGGYLMVKT
ncbi:MAG: LysE family translocator [Verrucomicrobiia bacterium]